MSNTLPILYSFRRCPYAMRARMGLMVSGQTCYLREIVLRDKPAQMLKSSPKGTVPVLVLPSGRVIEESLDIMMWALGENDPDGWLKPEYGTLVDMHRVIEKNDGPFKIHLDRYKYADRQEDVDPDAERAAALAYLEPLNERLKAQDYLFGGEPTLADIALFPFVRQFANVDRPWFDDLPMEPLRDWLAELIAAPVYADVMHKYPVWATGDKETLFG